MATKMVAAWSAETAENCTVHIIIQKQLRATTMYKHVHVTAVESALIIDVT